MTTPKTINDLVLADLRRAQRLILRTRAELDPQFRIATPEGDYWVAMTLAEDPSERLRQLALLSDFMALKVSPGFVMASEVKEPDAVAAIGVTHRATVAALSAICRNPLSFGPVEWLDAARIGSDFPGLLPRGQRTLSTARLAELEQYFGPGGRFPAIKIVPKPASRG